MTVFLRNNFSVTNGENVDIFKDLGVYLKKGFYMLRLFLIFVFLIYFKLSI